MFLTIAFYQFVSLENIDQLQAFILKFCQKNNIKGTILLASEGINGTISGMKKKFRNLLNLSKKIPFLRIILKTSNIKNHGHQKILFIE